jgi:large subunit ribosomal protein LP0
MSRGEGKKADRKKNYWNRLLSLLEEYSRILIVTADNVGSNHMQKIRKAMRGKAVLLMGKNTMIRKAIRDHLSKTPALEGILPHVKGNIGLVFTNGDLADIRTKLTELKIQAAAKAGSIAPIEVVVPAGNTNMEPTKTSFFQALSIPTKINRGTIEIINDIHLLTVGQKVSLSQAALLQMLGIRPFQYGLKVITVYDNGAVYPAAVLDLTDDDILKKFFKGVNNVAAISLQIGYPTVVSVPHSVSNGYKNLLAISVATDYTFPGSEKIKQLLSDPAAFAAAQAAAAAASVPAAGAPAAAGGKDAAPAAETKKPDKEKDEEEVDEDMGGLFGGEDEEEGY